MPKLPNSGSKNGRTKRKQTTKMCTLSENYCRTFVVSGKVGEIGARYVMGHILSVGFSRKLSSAGTLLLHEICLSLLGSVWYYLKVYIAMSKFSKFEKKTGFVMKIITF